MVNVNVVDIIKYFTNEFDSDKWSSIKAFEQFLSDIQFSPLQNKMYKEKKFDYSLLELYNIDLNKFNEVKQDVLKSWTDKQTDALNRGNELHQRLSNKQISSILGQSDVDFSVNNNLDFKGNKAIEEKAFSCVYKSDDIGLDFNLVGRPDLLMCNDNNIDVIDYKGLSLDTPLFTKTGLKTMGTIQVGDILFDKDGEETIVTHKSDIHYNKCYRITFNNNEFVDCDKDHRWVVSINKRDIIVTTEDLLFLKDSYSCDNIRIYNIKPIYKNNEVDIMEKLDPYLLGEALITNNDYNLESISNDYYLLPYFDRLQLLRGFMDNAGEYNEEKDEFTLEVNNKSLLKDVLLLFGTCGITTYVEDNKIIFKGFAYTPFLFRYQNNMFSVYLKSKYKEIISIHEIDTIPTQCITVDSKSHTYCFGLSMTVTHNSDKKIKKKSYFNKVLKKNVMMKYPLNSLMDCNYSHYLLQLNLYSWILKNIYKDINIDNLTILHFDEKDNPKAFDVEFKDQLIENMLKFYSHKLYKDNEYKKMDKIKY